jgi:hypothetical protein
MNAGRLSSYNQRLNGNKTSVNDITGLTSVIAYGCYGRLAYGKGALAGWVENNSSTHKSVGYNKRSFNI